MFRQRLRLQFTVKGDKRFLSHRDMMVLWERVLRRAGLPLKFGEGFNPHPRLSLPLPRNVGIASDDELLEFELSDWVNPDAALKQLAEQLPEDIEARKIEILDPSERAQPAAVQYDIRVAEVVVGLAEQIGKLMNSSEVLVHRQRAPQRDFINSAEQAERGHATSQIRAKKQEKVLNIRPFVIDIRADDGHIVMDLAITPTGTARPDEVLGALGLTLQQISRSYITRKKITLAKDSPRRNYDKTNANKRR